MIRSHLKTCVIFTALCTTPVFALSTATLAEEAPAESKLIEGTVLETMNSSGYTYLQVDSAEGPVWAAIPESKVTKGEKVALNPGMKMANFESKTLHRTFDSIVFSPGLAKGNALASSNPHGMAAAQTKKGSGSFTEALQEEQTTGSGGGAVIPDPMAGMTSGGSATNIVPSKDVKVEKAQGDNAYTVEECYVQAKDLDSKKVKVRGKVVKVSKMIMGKNWVHIQDGTGDPTKNSHDLVVTTMSEPALDSVVVVEGPLHADKDFGAGYRYDVIIEDADVK